MSSERRALAVCDNDYESSISVITFVTSTVLYATMLNCCARIFNIIFFTIVYTTMKIKRIDTVNREILPAV